MVVNKIVWGVPLLLFFTLSIMFRAGKMEAMVWSVCGRANDLYLFIVHQNLRKLYLHGPAIGQFGCWQGMTTEQICARITGQSEIFWLEQADKCQEMVEDRFSSFTHTLEALLYFYVVYQLCHTIFEGLKFVLFYACTSSQKRSKTRESCLELSDWHFAAVAAAANVAKIRTNELYSRKQDFIIDQNTALDNSKLDRLG
jgi:hypothetical protein